jgi:hypothetical protein
VNGGSKGFVDAVFAPGLGQGFQFDIGGVALFALVITADGLHLCEVEGQPPVGADLLEVVVGCVAEGDGFYK